MKILVVLICMYGIVKASAALYRLRNVLAVMPLGVAGRFCWLAFWVLLLTGSLADSRVLVLLAGVFFIVSIVLHRASVRAEVRKLTTIPGEGGSGEESEWETLRVVPLGNTLTIELSRKKDRFDDCHKLVMTKNGETIAEHGGDSLNRIWLQYSDNLLDGRYFLFGEQLNERDAGEVLKTTSVHIGAADIKTLNFMRNHIAEEPEAEKEYFGLDVDPSGRYVLLPYVVEDPDFPLLRVYDSREGDFVEFGTDMLTDCRMEEVRWGDSNGSLVFFDPTNEREEEALLDWESRSVAIKDR